MRLRHGMFGTTEYNIWATMIQRCYNPRRVDYLNYGARGIKVCNRWKNSFMNFYEDMGDRPDDMTLDRIDNGGDYEPSNCRWATLAQQALNKRTPKNNTSGMKNVYYVKGRNKWTVRAQEKYFGIYDTFQEACQVAQGLKT